MRVRKPAVAGQFYESDRRLLEGQIKGCFLHELGPGRLPRIGRGARKIVGLIVPHAGYIYSGPVAANSYCSLASDGRPEIFVIIGPNHTGTGSPISAVKSGKWLTPFGEAEIDTDTAEKIIGGGGLIRDDPGAHEAEHSIEVQLPFLQFVYRKVRFVPVCMLDQSYDACVDLSDALTQAAKGKDVVVIASSDFSHYVPYRLAYEKDMKALEHARNLAARRFYETVKKLDVSACGYGPVTTMLLFAGRMGAKSCGILRYATSGDVTGDRESVVGYCSAKAVK